jgi:D-glycero-D-manno-heptose 1,7-bisphosphate phosphatase
VGIDAVKRAVFLDRDGVLNRAIIRDGKPFAPTSLADLEILPGVPEALARLRAARFLLIVVTNQPDVARGTASRDAIDAIHAHMQQTLPLDDIRVCFHDDGDGCACRKPKPGMLMDAAADWDIDLKRSFVIGDRWRDIAAGQAAGCTTVLVDGEHHELSTVEPDTRKHTLEDAAAWIISRTDEDP